MLRHTRAIQASYPRGLSRITGLLNIPPPRTEKKQCEQIQTFQQILLLCDFDRPKVESTNELVLRQFYLHTDPFHNAS